MKIRCMIKTPQGWKKETPDDVSKWMWKHDGEECVVVEESDPAAKIYYCGTPSMMESYRAAWEKEGKVGDRRKAEPFITLDRILFAAES